MSAAKIEYDDADFDWIQLSKELAPDQPGFWSKTVSKFKENPFVPIGKSNYNYQTHFNVIVRFA